MALRERTVVGLASVLVLGGVVAALLIPSVWRCPSGGEVLPLPQEAIDFGHHPPCSVPSGEEPVNPYGPNDGASDGATAPPRLDTAYLDQRVGLRVLIGMGGLSLAAIVLLIGLRDTDEDLGQDQY